MPTDFRIRPLTLDDLRLVLQWAEAEGWNPGRHDADAFFVADPHGFWGGERNGELIAAASNVRYDQNNAFAGLYIVKKSYRGLGYGMQLTEHLMQHAQDCNVGLDGVLENVHLYERIGFKFFFKNYRFTFQAQNQPHKNPAIQPIREIPFDRLLAYDRQCFPAPRTHFLRAWLNQPEAIALAYVMDGQVAGYGVCRRCNTGYKIGPLFADTPVIAEALIMALQSHGVAEPYFLDVPEINRQAMQLAQHLAMQPVFATARMYLHELPPVAYHKIYGVTSFELG